MCSFTSHDSGGAGKGPGGREWCETLGWERGRAWSWGDGETGRRASSRAYLCAAESHNGSQRRHDGVDLSSRRTARAQGGWALNRLYRTHG